MTATQNARNEPRAAVSASRKLCEWCHKGFDPYRHWSRFCGVSCKREHEAAARRLGEQQLDLLRGAHGLARATDPVSSHEAAVEVTEAGTRQRDAERALLLVREHPGLTTWELATVAERRYPQWWGAGEAGVERAYRAIGRRLGTDLRDREGLVCNRRDLDRERQYAEPDRHKVAGRRGTPVEWHPVPCPQESAA